MGKPITVSKLKLLCEEQIKRGNADKVIMISDDDEGNGFHYLWYSFSELDDVIDENIYIDEEIATKEDTIILG